MHSKEVLWYRVADTVLNSYGSLVVGEFFLSYSRTFGLWVVVMLDFKTSMKCVIWIIVGCTKNLVFLSISTEILSL